MTENKTQVADVDARAYLAAVTPERKREDALAIASMMERLSGNPPRMWGPSIVGFGSYHYRYESGREGDAALLAFSPRRSALTLYLLGDVDRYQDLLAKLGTFELGKACLYIKKLDDVDLEVLEEIVAASLAFGRETFETT